VLSLPVYYSNAADLYLIGKLNLDPGLELIKRAIEEKSSFGADFSVNG
jgi:hypothetical protein